MAVVHRLFDCRKVDLLFLHHARLADAYLIRLSSGLGHESDRLLGWRSLSHGDQITGHFAELLR